MVLKKNAPPCMKSKTRQKISEILQQSGLGYETMIGLEERRNQVLQIPKFKYDTIHSYNVFILVGFSQGTVFI